jgi:hypothetical protein
LRQGTGAAESGQRGQCEDGRCFHPRDGSGGM